MTLYTIIYSWLTGSIFTSDMPASEWQIGGVSYTLQAWLAHTATIAILVLGVIVLLLIARWLFKVVGGAIVGIGK